MKLLKKVKFYRKNILSFGKWQSFFTLIILGIILFTFPAQAQQFYLKNYLPELNFPKNFLSNNNVSSEAISGCIRLDGRCQFRIAAPPGDLKQRVKIIETRLRDILQTYFEEDKADLDVKLQEIDNLQDIYIYINNQEFRLMTVTNWDAEIDGTNITNKAELIAVTLASNIPIAKKERTVSFLIRQGFMTVIILAFLVLFQIIISRWLRGLKKIRERLKAEDLESNEPIYSQLTKRRKINFQEVQYRLVQLLNIAIWLGGMLLFFGLFPYTRYLQIVTINLIRIPVKLVIIGVLTYVLIRLSYALINQFSSVIVSDLVLNPIANQRLQLRVTTIATIVRSVITITWLAVGIILALSSIGVNIGPILAGLGIFSLALSLGSQNLIKDTINGFFIILEDQYAVGDVINVNDVGGLVENMNLRITQLRDAAGRLITIPNSEVRIVANLSSQWARADLDIPIAYNIDIDRALEVITKVANEMIAEKDWQDKIIDQPEILGVDNFGDRGLIIKVWIKTQPLKQWLVSREFRRRLIVAFSEAGIPLPLPQQEIWFREPKMSDRKGN
jgi:small conductance mechanosensitive channel